MDTLHVALENMPLYVFAMKEEDCVIILISIYGKNEQVKKTNFGKLMEIG